MAAHSDRAHAEYAPSAAYRWMRCHGSIIGSRGLPAAPSSIYAEEGTACHEAASAVLDGSLSFDRACRKWDLDDEQASIVEEYTDFCFDIHDAMTEQGETDVWVEKRMHAPGISGEFFGTGDWVGMRLNRKTRRGLLRVIDLKAGQVPVYVRDRLGVINPQLGSYVLLALAEMGAPVSPWRFDPKAVGIDEIKLTIVQPKVYDAPQSTVVEFDELEELLQALVTAIDAIEAGDDTRVAGEWCKFCPIKGACPELRSEAVRRAAMDFEPVTNIPFQEWAAVLAEAELIAAHVNGIREKIRRALEVGKHVEGFKLVAKRQTRKWKDWEYTERHLVAASGLHKDKFYSRKEMTPAAIEKFAKLNKFSFDLTDHVELNSPGPTIARADDPRPAVIVKPGADFEEE